MNLKNIFYRFNFTNLYLFSFNLRSWLVGSKKSSEPKRVEPTNQHPESLFCRFGIADYMRSADSITLSPNRQLGAVTDSLGRIFLIDIHKGVAIRMWKGIYTLLNIFFFFFLYFNYLFCIFFKFHLITKK